MGSGTVLSPADQRRDVRGSAPTKRAAPTCEMPRRSIAAWNCLGVISHLFIFGVGVTPASPAFSGAAIRLPPAATFSRADSAKLAAVVIGIVGLPRIVAHAASGAIMARMSSQL